MIIKRPIRQKILYRHQFRSNLETWFTLRNDKGIILSQVALGICVGRITQKDIKHSIASPTADSCKQAVLSVWGNAIYAANKRLCSRPSEENSLPLFLQLHVAQFIDWYWNRHVVLKQLMYYYLSGRQASIRAIPVERITFCNWQSYPSSSSGIESQFSFITDCVPVIDASQPNKNRGPIIPLHKYLLLDLSEWFNLMLMLIESHSDADRHAFNNMHDLLHLKAFLCWLNSIKFSELVCLTISYQCLLIGFFLFHNDSTSSDTHRNVKPFICHMSLVRFRRFFSFRSSYVKQASRRYRLGQHLQSRFPPTRSQP